MSTHRNPAAATPPASEPKPGDSASSDSTPRIIDSAELLQGRSLLLIRHLGEIYRLQTTRQGKLILTK